MHTEMSGLYFLITDEIEKVEPGVTTYGICGKYFDARYLTGTPLMELPFLKSPLTVHEEVQTNTSCPPWKSLFANSRLSEEPYKGKLSMANRNFKAESRCKILKKAD